jgi:pimeloyl-ACP methyl ester carboxylesterase
LSEVSIVLTKLGYLIDNPWSNALDRAKSAGRILADVLIRRHLGVRPITLIGFSLGARVIFYALVELAKQKQFGIVQDVFLLGGTLTASQSLWCETRSVVSGRYVNAFARNDWVLNYLFRATSGGIGTVAGLRPVMNVPGLENVDVTDKIAGHMSYRTFMPLILDQLGFPVFADYFDEPKVSLRSLFDFFSMFIHFIGTRIYRRSYCRSRGR